MLFTNIAIMNEDYSVTFDNHVVVEGTQIKYVGQARPEGTFDREYCGKGKLLMPGFYNAHAHSPMTLMRGYGENMTLNDWLNKRIFPFEDKLCGNDAYAGTMLSIAESLSNGIVSTSDMYFFCDDIVRATNDAGSKVNVSRALTSFDENEDVANMKSYLESKKLFSDFHNTSDGKIKVDMSLHAEYTSTPKLVKALANMAGENNAPVHVHISETKSEHEECKARRDGRTPTKYLSDLGLFEQGGLAAHCVWIEEEDAEILKEKNVSIASCPVSNLKLASGVMNAPMILGKGVNVALGTDSVASNNNLSILEEIKLFAIISKGIHLDPTLVSPQMALNAATRAGAVAQGRQDCGYIKEGYKADLIVLDLASPAMNPIHDIENNVVYSASNKDVIMTMIDGRVLYEDGEYKTIDIEKVVFEANSATKRILGELNE